MNIDIINIGHYRVTSHGERKFDLFNRQTDVVHKINAEQFNRISSYRTEDTCFNVEGEVLNVR